MMIYMNLNTKLIGVGLIFGLILGAAIGFKVAKGCGPRWKHGSMIDKFSRELNLTAGQRDKVSAILDDTRQKMSTLREEVSPRVKAIREDSRVRIREVLDPDQQVKFDALEAKWKTRWEKKKGKWKNEHASPA